MAGEALMSSDGLPLLAAHGPTRRCTATRASGRATVVRRVAGNARLGSAAGVGAPTVLVDNPSKEGEARVELGIETQKKEVQR